MSTTSSLEAASARFVHKALGSDRLEVIPLAGDASTRRYFRIAKDVQSWVLMVWEPFVNPESFPFLNVQKHFAKHGVQVPAVVDWDAEAGVVLLEDLGDLTLERKFWENQSQDQTLPYYEKAIDELIKIHGPATLDRDHHCSAFQIEFDTKKLLWEMNYGREHLLEKLAGLHLSEKAARQLEAVFVNVCEALHHEPKRLAHRDYHSRNLMLKLAKMRVIDFQDARLGPVQYDLVSLLYDSYVDLSETSRHHLLDYYLFESGLKASPSFSHEQFMRTMSLQIIQRCFKACGSFASFWNTRQDRRYLKYLPGTLKTVRETLGGFPQYQAFSAILDAEGLLERDFQLV